MSANRFARKMCSIFLGGMLAASWQLAAAAGLVTGKVTAVDPAKGMIEINGIPFELTASSKRELQTGTDAIKAGQAVGFEADGKKLIRIQKLRDGADFPAPMAPPGSSKRAAPVTR